MESPSASLATGGDQRSLPSVSVVIITHNRLRDVVKALDSVLLNDYPQKMLEVIVVDDASSDGTYEVLKQRYRRKVNVIRNEEAIFLAGSRNRGFKLSRGEYVLQMDDDCILSTDALRNLVNVMRKDETIGVAGPAVYYGEERLVYCGARIYPFYMPIKRKNNTEVIECEFVPGTVGLFRREAVINAGLWDAENFTFQAEDADVCLRIRRAGYHPVCVPWARAYHLKKPSLIDVSSSRRAFEAGRSRILLYRRNLSKLSFIFYLASVNILVLFLYVLLITLKRKSMELIGAYIRGIAHGLLTRN